MMVNNQPADEQAANLPGTVEPDADARSALPSVGSGTSPEAIMETATDAAAPAQARRRADIGARRNEPRASVTDIHQGHPSPMPALASSSMRPASSGPAHDLGANQPGANALGARELLSGRPTVRLLLVSDRATAPGTQQFSQRVLQLGHVVEVVSSDGWQRALAQAVPDVILVAPDVETPGGAAVGLTTAQQWCRALEAPSEAAGCLLAVLLEGVQSTLDVEAWSVWQAVGADVIIEAEVSPALLESTLETWARLVRLQRDANLLRDTLGKQVQVDDLTQLLNRRFFFQAAHREVSRARRYNHPLSCLMIDVNHFKLYNKTFGYACGDHILRSVAGTIRSWTRESDIIARFGAKKFVVLLPETDVEGAMTLHEKLHHAINNAEFLWEGHTLPLTISAGEAERRRDALADIPARALTPEDELKLGSEGDDNTPLSTREELADLLEGADAALYVAKKGVRYPNLPINPHPHEEISGILGAT